MYNIIVTAQEINITSIRGARNGSMGDALISESNDVSIMYLNPASLMFLKEKTLFFNLGHFQKNLGMRENFAAPVLQFTKFTLSVGLESYQMGYLKENFNFPGKQIFEYGYNISAASNIIEETFGVGAAFGFRSGSVGSSNNWAATYTLGINYSPSSDINYGLVLSGLGDNLEYMNEDTILTVKRESSNKRLVLGASMKFPSSSSLRRTVFVLALANEKIFGENGLLYKVGFEVSPWPVVNLRFGYVFGPQVSEPRFGAGLNLNLFMFDYVFYAGPSPVMMQQFSLSIKI
ncbi:MAG: hypothetical protein ACHQLA_00110 [Ignavibacteriales bacterium]